MNEIKKCFSRFMLLTLLVLTIAFFTGCEQKLPVSSSLPTSNLSQNADQTAKTEQTLSLPLDPAAVVDENGTIWHKYSAVAGLQFEYMDKFEGEKLFPVILNNFATDPNSTVTKIAFMELQKDGTMQDDAETLTVFKKLANQSIEEAIAGVIAKNGGKPAACKVQVWTKNPTFYSIITAKPTAYTPDELAQIEKRKKDYTADDGPEDANLLKREFDEQHLVSLCTTFAEPAGLGTSKSFPGYFIYNQAVNPTMFVYVPPQWDPLVYRNITMMADQ